MGFITKDYIDCGSYRIDFVGWTWFDDSKYPDFMDIFDKYSDYKKEPLKRADSSTLYIRKRIDKKGCEDIIKRLAQCQETAHELLIEILKRTGIRFSGEYHQNGDYGCPVIKITKCVGDTDSEGKILVSDKVRCLEGLEIKLTCTFRSWGGYVSEALGEGSYIDWAWEDGKEPIYPNENLLVHRDCGFAADASDEEFDKPLGD